MSEKQRKILEDLAEKLPSMTEHERGYLEAAAMSKKKCEQVESREVR